MNLAEVTILIENSIAGLKLDVEKSREKDPGKWTLYLRDTYVWIDVFNFQDNPDRYYFQVMSPLLRVPDKNKESFFTDVLDTNHKLYGSWISKKDNWLYVMNLREAAGLDQSEVDATIDRVAYYADDYKRKLSFKHEGSWLPEITTGAGADTDLGPGPAH